MFIAVIYGAQHPSIVFDDSEKRVQDHTTLGGVNRIFTSWMVATVVAPMALVVATQVSGGTGGGYTSRWWH